MADDSGKKYRVYKLDSESEDFNVLIILSISNEISSKLDDGIIKTAIVLMGAKHKVFKKGETTFIPVDSLSFSFTFDDDGCFCTVRPIKQ
jgi:hypothetical protein